MKEQNLKILVADDNPSDRMLLETMLDQLGHVVETAVDGQDAVEKFDPDTIQLVCLDIKMPRKDGWEAALEIQQIANEKLIPIVFLSGVSDPAVLQKCLDVGATDFISKPYSPTLVSAKLNAIARLLVLQNTLSEQRDELSVLNQQMVHDQEVAKLVYERITHSNCLSDPALSTLHHGSHIFNGDVILAAYKPNGGIHLLLGDFTGHGLSAAIGALPLADIFFDWTEKGFVMRQILPEINKRLHNILPPNMFCAAAFVDINAHNRTVAVWNAGLPDLLYFAADEKVPRMIASDSLPLGILNEYEFDANIEMFSYESGDFLLAFTDGVYEARTRDNKIHYNTALDPLYAGSVSVNPFVWLENMLQKEGILENPHDDISVLGIDLAQALDHSPQAKATDVAKGGNVPADFAFRYELNAETLKSTDPLPYLLQILTTVPELSKRSGEVFMILSEMYSNALEHGILKLDSNLKRTVEGFAQYYSSREAKLAQLSDGWITIDIKVSSDSHQGCLSLTMADSGDGYDTSQLDLANFDHDMPFNRGLSLINQLCQQVSVSDNGSCISVQYHW
ncbi:Alkaline phosphatase synthesis transcriptional regulatory protein PhoP [Marinomonas aquimarina]|uniref:Alkaline phosphatase synthesis transcriptional regulatory protein PhoP n=1 Tax=Marinomonas aquimarina TaxID=295068 RepID=A0A1A8T1Z6_9GAMM|nr:SpoIIE family protein phosphatase [Marinomonas aquimarina]SBS24935.1 Alkaline phosphatase synthesis transcriptional regulatory protein PhoP [Marinomonas aquimarina]